VKRPGVRGLVGATIAVGAFSAALAIARPLFDSPPPPIETVAPGAPVPSGASRARGWLARIETRLAQRVPALAESDRIRLADTIVEEAFAASLDPLLVLALIEVESGFDPSALSGRGARGLMQLRPSTLRHEAARWRLPGSDPSDPVLNVKAGVRYYRRLLTAFRNHEELALMAYNAGPQRISGYLKAGEVPDRFRAYPKRVRAELRRLRHAFGGAEERVVATREPAAEPDEDDPEPEPSAERPE
jgi:soluble lytic murein transglycosylase